MKRLLAMVATMALSLNSAPTVSAQVTTTNLATQKNVPVHEVVMSAISTETFKTLTFAQMVRALPDGKLLVNDWGRQRLIVLDSTMNAITIMADQSGTTATPYPGEVFPLIRYFGDSTLLADWASSSFAIADPSGKLVRAIAAPNSSDLLSLAADPAGHPGINPAGNLYYRAGRTSRFLAKEKLERAGATAAARQMLDSSLLDTVAILRANFDTRKVDTVGSYIIAPGRSERTFVTPDGKSAAVRQLAPFAQSSDDWGLLSDGTIAIARAHDYHIDFIAPNGTLKSGPKLPYYAQRLTDADKLARIDSMKRVIDSVNNAGKPYGQTTVYRRTPEGQARIDTVVAKIAFDALDKIPDYLPAFREGSVQIDNDDHIWILPTALAARVNGTLYDVIDRNGTLVERVHFPDGVIVLGFGKGDVVYFTKAVPGTYMWLIGRGHIMRQ